MRSNMRRERQPFHRIAIHPNPPQTGFVRSWAMVVCLLASSICQIAAQEQQDPTTMNGGSILAMAGRECVAVAVDRRFGSGPQMVTLAPRKVLTPHSHLLVGFTGLEGDVQTLYQELDLQIQSKLGRSLGFATRREDEQDKLVDIDESRSSDGMQRRGYDDLILDGGNGLNPQLSQSPIAGQQAATAGMGSRSQRAASIHRSVSARAMASLTSHVLYNRRNSPYYVEPVVAGLMPSASERKAGAVVPFLCGMDLIGAQSKSDAFVVCGTASDSLYGTAEALWRPGLEPMELARVCGMAFQSALERDCLSGYGTIVYLLMKDQGILELEIANRND